ncbi:MAG TPA: sn-glycerol-3-phosphate ABC transporter ATP-binding protein UgpC [Aestuariivirgaceae bacterium]|jgi:multiple sugar transport system ATP-binding protein|nr:sn-glycerol-3-phosphate ABC transporter ATP-binding protein UgpC [Aestuariivirgaceae bacterium]
MAAIALDQVDKIYPNGVHAVRDVSLDIRDGEFMILLGPSGCGKSTTLRMVAGLESVTGGTISIGGRIVNDVDPADRDIAIVFQNYALYPHMTVAQNLAFGLKLRRVGHDEIDRRIARIAETLGIGELLGRKPRELSGGQRQRVALGRALVREPKAFLLDEPLSNLDAKLRASMRTELIKLHRQLGTTIVHVTHDQVEAMTMGQRICIMRDGIVVQTGAPMAVYREPVDTFVAGFLASPPMNLLNGRLESVQDGSLAAVMGGVGLRLPEAQASLVHQLSGREVILGLRPEDFHLAPERGHPVEAYVVAIEVLGPEVILVAALGHPGNPEIMIRCPRGFTAAPGEKLTFHYDPREIHIFDVATKRALPRPSRRD